MAEEEQNNIWSLPKFYFQLSIEGKIEASFLEVSGLDSETDSMEYQHGESPEISNIKMTGLKNSSDVTLKKGSLINNSEFLSWLNEIKSNTISRKTAVIKLLDENGNPEIVWTLTNAFPTKIQGKDLNSSDREIAIDLLVLSHEGLEMSTP